MILDRTRWLILRLTKKYSRKSLYEFLETELEKLPIGSGEILNIGSGGEIESKILPIIIQKGYTYRSIDIDEKRKPEIVGDICTTSLENSKYDVVVVAEVLEHLHTPQTAIKNIYGSLKENGVILATVPFIFPVHETPNDFQRWTEFGLAKLFSDFSFVSIRMRNNWAEAINVLVMRLITERQDTLIRQLLCNGIVLLSLLIAPFVSLLGGFLKFDAISTGYVVKGTKAKTSS